MQHHSNGYRVCHTIGPISYRGLMSATVQTTPEIEVVQSFLRALEELDVERAATLLAPDVEYQNVSLPATHGARAVTRQLEMLPKYCTRFEARTHSIASTGSKVLTERTDVLARGRFSAEFWVCGIFEVHNGLITSWRDYFDWANVLAAFAKGAGRAALAAATRRWGKSLDGVRMLKA